MNDIRLPILKPAQLIKALEKYGFARTRKSRGSHFRYAHPDGRKTTVPFHEGKDIGRGLLRKILKDADISIEELHKLIG